MKTVGAVVIAAAIALLAGCSSTPEPAPTVTVTAAAEATPEPLVSEAASPTQEAPTGDAAFAAKARTLIPEIADATDASIVATAHRACDMLAQGIEKQNMQLIQGEEPQPGSGWYMRSAGLASLAANTYCPEYS